MSKLRMAVATVGALTLIGSGVMAVARIAADDGKPTSDGPPAAPSHPDTRVIPPTSAVSRTLGGDPWPLSLRDAIRIGLDNTKIIRVIAFGPAGRPVGGFEPGTFGVAASGVAHGDPGLAPIVIAPVSPAADVQRFRSEVMAHVRSVEQQYWNLSLAHVQVWAAERAVSLAQEIFNREQAEFKAKRGTASDVVEAQQRLEQFRLDLVTRTSDVVTAERHLRNLLGLPPADNRRIIPVSQPIEARLEPDWDKSRAALLENQPEILKARALAKQAQGRDDPALLERQKAFLQQVVHQTTHSLARFFLEIDANYKQFQASSRVRHAAAQRLNAMRADREAGRIPVDRFLDAVSQYAAAVSTEAQYRATYNIAIIALEEAKGTLLEYDKITVAGTSKETGPSTDHPDGRVNRTSPQPTAPGPVPSSTSPPAADSTGPAPGAPPAVPPAATGADKKADAAGKTYTFHLSIGLGSTPIEIRGSFTVGPAGAPDATGAGLR